MGRHPRKTKPSGEVGGGKGHNQSGQEVDMQSSSPSVAPDIVPIQPEAMEVGEMLVDHIVNMEIGEDRTNGMPKPVEPAATIGYNEVFPHIYGYLEKKDVLNCRVASKEWTMIVDGYLEILPRYFPYRHDSASEKKLRTLWETEQGSKVRRKFPTAASLSNFQKGAQGHPTNPFVGRSISLTPSRSEASLYWDRAKRMARAFGEHVWFLKITTTDLDIVEKAGQVYKNVKEILSLFPNLRYLKISHEDKFKKMVESVEKKLKRLIDENPLPKLPQLETLDLPLGLGDVIRGSFLDTYGKQVGKLVTRFQKWDPNGATLPNLTELSLQNVPSFERLSTDFLRNINATNLQKLEMNLQFSLDVHQLFKALQPFSSLKALRLQFSHGACCEECDECDLCTNFCHWEPLTLYRKMGRATLPMILPRLESFVVMTASPFMNFQYLKSLPKLKYLQFNFLSHLAGGEGGNRDDIGEELRKFSRNETTKFWKMMPTLKHCTIGNGTNYNRPIEIKSENPWTGRFKEILPQLFCDFKKNDWLLLRRVSKSWKRDIQNFIENHPLLRPFNIEAYHLIGRSRHSDLHMELNFHCIGFPAPITFSNYQQAIIQNQSTDYPFVGRSIALSPFTSSIGNKEFRGQAALNKFWKSAIDFLQLFGRHVWFLTITHLRQDVREDEIFFYRNLQRCLENLPNLKYLRIDDSLKVKGAQGKDREQLNKFMKEHPLPNLQHFESLRILSDFRLPAIIEDYFFNKYGGQLQRLEMFASGWSPKLGDLLPNLVHLSISKITCNLMLPRVLCTLKAPCLLKLELHIETAVPEHFLFKLLEPFKSVCNLSILIKQNEQSKSAQFQGMILLPTDYRLHSRSERKDHHLDEIEKMIILPNVDHLYVRVCHAQQSFQFLKSFPGLKFLQIRICKNDELSMFGPVGVEGDEIGKELRLCKVGGQGARQSKIWEMLPKLKDILILPGTKLSRTGYIYIDRQWIKNPPLMFRMI